MTTADCQDDRRASFAHLWDEHRRAPFPARLRGEEVAGVDMVMVDADLAGCVDTWLGGSGPLDPGRLSVLRDLVQDLDGVLPLLQDEHERRYYERVRDLARLMVDVGGRSRT